MYVCETKLYVWYVCMYVRLGYVFVKKNDNININETGFP